MAIVVFSDGSSAGISPRISFSHDLIQSDDVPVEECVRTSSSSSSVDFDFCVFRESLDFESSSADEIFSDGKILPLQFKQKLTPSRPVEPTRPPPPQLPRPNPPLQKFNNSRAIVGHTVIRESEEKHKSFWWFKRSWSFKCIGGGTTLCPFPLLSRSNSAGSPAGGNLKQSPLISNNERPRFVRSKSSSSWQRQAQSAARPLLKRSNSHGHGYYKSNNLINMNRVLNLPPARSTTNLLGGLICIFPMGKDRRCNMINKKKKKKR